MHSPYAGMGMNPMAFVDVDGQEAITLAALGVAALKGAIIASIASAVKYSSEAVAFETWDWGDFGKTVGVSAAMGAVSGGLAYGIGEVGSALASGGMGEVGVGIISTGLHMGTQGGLSAAMGGDFWSAALAAGVGHLGGAGLDKMGVESTFGRAAGASMLGGAASLISGGSFFEGAATALVVHMLNYEEHRDKNGYLTGVTLDEVIVTPDKTFTISDGIAYSAAAWKFYRRERAAYYNAQTQAELDAFIGGIHRTTNVAAQIIFETAMIVAPMPKIGAVGKLASKVPGKIPKYALRFAKHGPHHKFGKLGKLPHFQINIWQKGVKGSGRTVFRIPLPK